MSFILWNGDIVRWFLILVNIWVIVGLDVARIGSKFSKTVLQRAILPLQSQFTALAVG